MRYLVFAAVFLASAFVLAACSDPVKTASQVIDKTTTATIRTEASYKRIVRDRMLAVAAEEATRRTQLLKGAGCSTAATQPTTAAETCQNIALDATSRYLGRIAKIKTVAARLDAGTAVIYATLLLAIDALDDFKDGLGSLTNLTALGAKCWGLLTDLVRVYDEAKTLIGSF